MEPVLENNFVLSSATLLGLSLIFGVGPLSFLYELACGCLFISILSFKKSVLGEPRIKTFHIFLER